MHSGDHILQIGDINVRGMGSEQVASVLRQSGTHVRLIIARGVLEPSTEFPPYAPIIPTQQLSEHLQHLNAVLADYQDYIASTDVDPSTILIADGNMLPAEIHAVCQVH